MATPAVRALRRHFPTARLIGVLRPYVAGVLEGAPWLDGQVLLDTRGPWSRRWPAAAWALRRLRLDVAVLFPNSFRSAWVARLAGCPRRVGYARGGRTWLLSDRLEPLRDAAGGFLVSPVLDAYNRLATHLGCPDPGRRMELFTTATDETAADIVWEQARLHRFREVVCLNPGAAYGSAKHWPAQSFAHLAQLLADQRGSGVLVLCGPGERDLAAEIGARARRDAVCTLADTPLSLGLTKACVRRADLLVTTDSGPRHFAAAFDRPVVTLFGPTHIAWTETHHTRAFHLQKKVECGPCQLRVCPLDHRCMKQLAPEEAFAAAEELLSRQHQRKAS
jgi:heptosyltransferase-2